jgi:surface antigen
MANRKAEIAERQARLAAIQAAQRKTERRRTTIIAAIAGVVILALIGATFYFLNQDSKADAALQDAADKPIEGVQEFSDLSRNHVEGDVQYPQNPPVGGDHNAVWQNCGVYSQPVTEENAVHSMEHGAVWITYDPSLPADQVADLTEQAASNNYILVTPREDLPSPVVLSAWGVQLQLQDASDARVGVFLEKYVRGEQTPEPGAPCSGGTGTPE